MKSHNIQLISISLMVIIIFIGCGMRKVDSTWRDRTVTIDGVDEGSEWGNARYYFEDKKVTVGLLNDENMLYIRLSSRDTSIQRQILSMGLTLWFDEKGGSKKTFGIHFPLGMQTGRAQMMETKDQDRRPDTPDRTFTIPGSIQDQIEFIGQEKNTRSTMSVNEAQKYGVNCGIENTKGNLVYELQVPLKRTDDNFYGIMMSEVKKIGIGIETGTIDLSQVRQQSGTGSGGRSGRGGMGGGGGRGGTGGRGGMGGGQGRRGGQINASVELWLQTTLAQNLIAPE